MLPLYLVLAALIPAPSMAHLAFWHPSMFGFDGDEPGVVNYNTNRAVNPLKLMDNKKTAQWFGNGLLDFPPAKDVFLELPAGGTVHGEVACNRGLTTMRDPRMDGKPFIEHACDSVNAMHTVLDFGDAVNATLLGGCALSISYATSDVKQAKPSDFTVISTNATCGWWRETDFNISSNMPACPQEGCLCAWNWIHTAGNFNAAGRGEGYGSEMNHLLYRCNVTRSLRTTEELSVGAGQVANECSHNPSNCTLGPKQPHYWSQADGNNNFSPDTSPPLHNMNYGFRDGAQDDIFVYHAIATATAEAESLPPAPTATSSLVSVATADPIVLTPAASRTTSLGSASSSALVPKSSSSPFSKASPISSDRIVIASSSTKEESTPAATPSAISALSSVLKHRNSGRSGMCRPKNGTTGASQGRVGMHKRSGGIGWR